MTRLVLLPGMDGTGELFAGLTAALPPELEPVIVSYPRDEPLGYPALLQLVKTAVPTDQPFVLVAESFSAPLAVIYAATDPANLLGVVLCGGFCTSPAQGWWRVVGLWLSRWMFHIRIPEFAADRWLLGDDPPPALVASLRAAVSWVEPEVMATRLRAALNCDVRNELALVEAPVRYLQPTRDRLIDPESQAEMRLIHPGKTVVVDGPHLLFQREPVLAAEVLTSFVRELRG